MFRSEYHNETSLTKFVLICDLDETCLHTLSFNNDEAAALKMAEDLGVYTNPSLMDIRDRSFRLRLDDPVTPRGSGVQYGCWGITRPHLKEFFTFAFVYFERVIIWTAGVKAYANQIANFISRDTRKFKLVYTRNDCVLVEGEYTKPLDKMIAEHPEVGPIEHMFIVDDRLATAIHNPDNLINIPIYKPEPTIQQLRMEDDNLIRLKYWLLQPHVMEVDDIRTLDKSDIFTKSPSEYMASRKD